MKTIDRKASYVPPSGDGITLERALGALALSFFFVPKSSRLSTFLMITSVPLAMVALVDGEPRRNCTGERT